MDDDNSDRTYSADQIEQLLRCSVCLDRYRQPKLLPCQHTYCMDPCLEGLVNYFTRKIKCPDCRAEHQVSHLGVSAFPNNLSIMAFLDLPSSQLTARGSEQRQAVREPEQHTQNNRDARHPVATPPQEREHVDDAPPMRHFLGDGTGCPSCGSERNLSLCLHCDQALCDACKRYHLDQLKLDISRLVNMIRRGLPKLAETLSTVEQGCEQVRQQGQTLRTEINDAFERYIRNLKSRQRLVLNECETYILGELRSLRFFQENLEVEIASTASFCDTTEATLERSNHNAPDEDLLSIRSRCTEHMDNIRLYESGGVRMPHPRRIEFYTSPQLLSSAIINFGEVQLNSSPEASPPSENDDATDEPAPSAISTEQRNQSSDDLSDVQPDNNVEPLPEITAESSDDDLPMSRNRSVPTRWSSHGVGRRYPTSSDSSHSLPAALSWDEIIRANTVDDDALAAESRRERMRHRRQQHLSDTRIASLTPATSSITRRSGDSPSSRPEISSLSPRISRPQDGVDNTSSSTIDSLRVSPRLASHDDVLSSPRLSRPSPRVGLLVASRLSRSQGSGAIQIPGRHGSHRDTIREESTSPSRSDNSSTDNGAVAVTGSRHTRPRVRQPVRFDVGRRRAAEESSEESDNALATYTRVSGGASSIIQSSEINYQAKERSVVHFGERGNGENQFTWPRGVAVSPIDDTIVVADSSNHRVTTFDANGRLLKSFGSYGVNEGEFDCLAGVAVNSFGQIIISDRYNHRIQIFDHQGNLQTIFGSEGTDNGLLNYPWGVAVDTMGFIYVCDKENHRVQVFQSNGTFVRKFGRYGNSVAQFENPHYLAVSPENEIYVSDTSNHRIQVFTRYGDLLFTFGSQGSGRGQLKHPKGIAIDREGFVIVADSGNSRVQVFRGDGRHYTMFGGYGIDSGGFKGLEGVALLSNGNIVVSDRENHRIQIL